MKLIPAVRGDKVEKVVEFGKDAPAQYWLRVEMIVSIRCLTPKLYLVSACDGDDYVVDRKDLDPYLEDG